MKYLVFTTLLILLAVSSAFAGIKEIPEGYKFAYQNNDQERIITTFFLKDGEQKDNWTSRIADTTYMLMSKVTPSKYLEVYKKNIRLECADDKIDFKISYDNKNNEYSPIMMMIKCENPKEKQDNKNYTEQTIIRVWKEEYDLRILEWRVRGDAKEVETYKNYRLNFILRQHPLQTETIQKDTNAIQNMEKM